MIYRSVNIIFNILEFILIARVLVSWLPVPKNDGAIRLLYQISEPMLAPVRRLLERSAMGRNMMFDFSPIIVFLIIAFIKNIILNMVRNI